ncbi:hypothetical protein Q3G72_013134 [Acer saccharum]|nr:hypothetical protein Q3G72_013134 [Acer saccharum]
MRKAEQAALVFTPAAVHQNSRRLLRFYQKDKKSILRYYGLRGWCECGRPVESNCLTGSGKHLKNSSR